MSAALLAAAVRRPRVIRHAVQNAVIAEAPTYFGDGPPPFVPQVSMSRDGRVLITIHTVDQFNEELAPLSEEGFRLRREHLMEHLITALKYIRDTPAAILHAFDRMNLQLKYIFEGSTCWENYWRCQYNSLVVVVGHAHVYVAGEASADVILSRNGKDMELTDEEVSMRYTVNRFNPDSSLKEITGMCYYRKEALTEDDTHVIVCSSHARAHVDGDITPVLTTRIDAFGLQEACRQIVGECCDHNRTLVVVPVGLKISHDEEGESDPVELGWVNSIPPRVKVEANDEMDEEDGAVFDSESEDDNDPASVLQIINLKPLVNGEPQYPEPSTSCRKLYRLSPSIRSFILPYFCRVDYGGRTIDIVVDKDPVLHLERYSNFRSCYLRCANTEKGLIKILLEDQLLEDRHVILLVPDTEALRAVIAGTDGLAFWDLEKWGQIRRRRASGNSDMPFGFIGLSNGRSL